MHLNESIHTFKNWDLTWKIKMTPLPFFFSSMGSLGRVSLPRSDWAYHGFFLCPFFPAGAQHSEGFQKRTLTHCSQSSRSEPLFKVIIKFILSGLTFLNWVVMGVGQMYVVTPLKSVLNITWIPIPSYWVTNVKFVTGHGNKNISLFLRNIGSRIGLA